MKLMSANEQTVMIDNNISHRLIVMARETSPEEIAGLPNGEITVNEVTYFGYTMINKYEYHVSDGIYAIELVKNDTNPEYSAVWNEVSNISKNLLYLATVSGVKEINQSTFSDNISRVKSQKIKELQLAMNLNISRGIDVETDQGTEHFSLTIFDQKNIETIVDLAEDSGFYPYHADGKLCRLFSAKEIKSIADGATKHITHQTTLFNFLKNMVNGCEVVDDISSIHYGIDSLTPVMLKNFNELVK